VTDMTPARVSGEAKPLISIVTPMYNEEGNVEELARRLRAVFDALPLYDFEVLAIENGSGDGTYDRLLAEHARDPRFKIIQLSRNFRPEGGITAGLSLSRGDAVVVMCADLQDPPELIPEFVKKWEQGFENVYGIVTERQGVSRLRARNSKLFYAVINSMTGGTFPRDVSDFRLVDRKVVDAVLTMPERKRFMRGMFYWAGFKSIGIAHERPPRFAGDSKAGTLAMLELAMTSVFSYSYVPLRMITLVGLAVSLFAFALLVFIVIRGIFWGGPFQGYATIMSVFLLMFGFLFTMLGVVAEYVGLIYEEVKQRPNFVVSETIGL